MIEKSHDPVLSPPDWAARLRRERKQAQTAARAFFAACKAGDVDSFFRCCDALAVTDDGWRLAIGKVGKLASVNKDIRRAFLELWIEHKMLPLSVGHRPTMARALRVLMPRPVVAAPVELYRGTSAGERKRHLYGFSWTTEPEIARRFADRWRPSTGGAVLLKTNAPPAAILLVRKAEDYYDEGEVVVDPYRLGRIELVERLPHIELPRPRVLAGRGGVHLIVGGG